MIKSFDRTNLKQLRVDIDKALEAVGKQHGIVLKAGSASFEPTNATFKLACSVITPDGTVVSKEAEDFKRRAFMYGLRAEDLGETFTFKCQEYEIVGLSVKARTAPILCKQKSNGKVYKFDLQTVKMLLAL